MKKYPTPEDEAFDEIERRQKLMGSRPEVDDLLTRGWGPIETAPKDNKRPLYLARISDEGELVELDFNGSWEYWQESWELPHINGYCWMSANGIEEPTHWAYQDAPLPTLQHLVQQETELDRHIRNLTTIVRMPNAEHVADAHNAAVKFLRGFIEKELDHD